MTTPTTPNDEFIAPEGAPNVRFISPKVQAQAALEEYSRCLKQLFTLSVQLLLMAKNAAVTHSTDDDIQELLVDTQLVCQRLCACSKVAKGAHTSGNLYRYLNYLLQKAETEPTVEVFYEIASLAEVLSEGFDAARVS